MRCQWNEALAKAFWEHVGEWIRRNVGLRDEPLFAGSDVGHENRRTAVRAIGACGTGRYSRRSRAVTCEAIAPAVVIEMRSR